MNKSNTIKGPDWPMNTQSSCLEFQHKEDLSKYTRIYIAYILTVKCVVARPINLNPIPKLEQAIAH